MPIPFVTGPDPYEVMQRIQAGGDRGRALGKQNRLASLASQAYAAPDDQQRGIVQQAIANDPQSGFQLAGNLDTDRQAGLKQIGQVAQMMVAAPDDATREAIHQRALPLFQRLGLPTKPNYDPAELPMIQHIAQQFGGGGQNDGPPAQQRYLEFLAGQVPEGERQDVYRNAAGTNPRARSQVYDSSTGAVNINTGTNTATPIRMAGAPAAPQAQFTLDDAALQALAQIPSQERAAALQAMISGGDFHAGPDGSAVPGISSGAQVQPRPKPVAPQQPAEFERKAAYLRAQGVPEDKITQMVMGGAGQGQATAPGDPTKTGEEYLATLPPEMRNVVKAIASGNQLPPSSSARSPQAQALLQAVYAYDPSASATNLPARTQTRKDFTSGKSAQNLRSLNQAIGHLGLLHEQIGGTAAHSIPVIGHMVNQGENAYARASGHSGITNYEQTAAALAGELTQVFRGNSGAEADLVRNLQQLDSAQSNEQKQAAVRNIVGLLNSRIDELGQQYSQGMGKVTDPYSLLNPHAVQVLQGIGGIAPSGAQETKTINGQTFIKKDGQWYHQ